MHIAPDIFEDKERGQEGHYQGEYQLLYHQHLFKVLSLVTYSMTNFIVTWLARER